MNVTLRRSIAVGAALLAAPLLASCGLNFAPQTDQIYTPASGVNNRTGAVDVIDAQIVTKSGGAGTLVAGLVNKMPHRADRLTGVTGAKSNSGLTAQMQGPVVINAGGLNQLGSTGAVSVYGQLKPGLPVWVTFNFQHAKSITMQIPVTTPDNGLQSVPLPSSPVPTTPTPSPSPTPKKHQKKSHS